MNDLIICPFCGEENELGINSNFKNCTESHPWEKACEYCNKVFIYTAEITYHCFKLKDDCLNNGSHNYKKIFNKTSNHYTLYCNICGDTKPFNNKGENI
jgi:hypothetical protein